MDNYRKLKIKGIEIRESLEELKLELLKEENLKYKWSLNTLGYTIDMMGNFLRDLSDEEKELGLSKKEN